MHRCLAVEDIVEEILLFAEASSDAVGSPRAPSYAFLRACKAFYEPACNVRWRVLKSFLPLVQLFSNGVPRQGPTTLDFPW